VSKCYKHNFQFVTRKVILSTSDLAIAKFDILDLAKQLNHRRVKEVRFRFRVDDIEIEVVTK
jgi:hypothetical protein